ncbi:MAG: hypothetical protein K0R54_2274 [Clostridiaceae bacterium]|jgi:hypothetical protein|nr:hypothetical protein [Clostridiaceae bacterium]
MGDTEFEKELNELQDLLKELNNIKVVRNIKCLVKDYIEETERAIS